jgi:hypothetical protein
VPAIAELPSAGDTGLISNNATAAATSSAHMPGAGFGSTRFMTSLTTLMLSLGSAALMALVMGWL